MGSARGVASTLAAPPDTILLVEDDPDIAEMYRFKLEYDGYRVHLAMTGETALTLAFESRADLALLDMGLPGMDGLQVLAALRADHRTFSLPVVILSNYDDPDLIQRGLRLGAIDYLIKSHITPAGVSGGIALWMAAQPACVTRIAMEYDRANAGPGGPARNAVQSSDSGNAENAAMSTAESQMQAGISGRTRRVA